MARRKRGKNSQKLRSLHKTDEDKFKNSPHSFVFHKGDVGLYIKQLVTDVRGVMEPYTATKLKVTKNNSLKDFLNIAGTFDVTHFMIFSRNKTSVMMKLMKVPRGPTVTFKVENYSLRRDVVSLAKSVPAHSNLYLHHPLLVMDGFDQSRKEHKLIHSTLQNMFPAINIYETPLDKIRRCLLIKYEPDSDSIHCRHYCIKLNPANVSRAVKKLMQSKLPKLGQYDDVADYFLNPGAVTSESEMEPEPNEVDINQSVAERGITEAGKCSIRLTEIGPRMTLKLVRIQDDAGCGKVLYSVHADEIGEVFKAVAKKRRNRTKKDVGSAKDDK